MAPTTLTIARQILFDPSSFNDAIVPCWEWRRGSPTTRPMLQIRPHPTCHPVRFYFQTGYLRICQGQRCVNPFHFIQRPRPASLPKHPLVFDAEGELELRKPTSLTAALTMLRDDYPAPVTLHAYRNLRQDDTL